MKKVRIEIVDLVLEATLNTTSTAESIYNALPLSGSLHVWGEEVYFYFDLDLPLESDARDVLSVGELGYWPSGPAFCIFFGPTPMSHDENPKAASPVNVFGKLNTSNFSELQKIKDGTIIKINKSND